jgi:TnpA family transposase
MIVGLVDNEYPSGSSMSASVIICIVLLGLIPKSNQRCLALARIIAGRMGRELNKGEASHDLSRFLCFGKEGALRGREFGDKIHTFSCLSVLHNAVVTWNTLHIGPVVEQLRAEGHTIDDTTLSLTTPLLRKHINPFGKYHFDLERMRQTADPSPGETP